MILSWSGTCRRHGTTARRGPTPWNQPSSTVSRRTTAAWSSAPHTATTHDWPISAALLLYRGRPEDPWNNPAVWPQWQRLLAHLLTTTAPDRHHLLTTQHDTLIDLLNSISDYLHTSGQPRQALPHAQHAHRLAHHRHGPDHTTLDTRLAIRLSALGEHEAARELGEDTLTRCRRIPGEDHPDTLREARNLVAVLRELDRADALQAGINNAISP